MSTVTKKKKFFNKSQDTVKKSYINARDFFRDDLADGASAFDDIHSLSSKTGKSRNTLSSANSISSSSSSGHYSTTSSAYSLSSSSTGYGTGATGTRNGTNAEFDSASHGDDDYVKLRRVKKAHQCAELGEREEFDGDIKFYLDGLNTANNINTRCLSILGLANQCQRAEFRMHLRAHDDMPKIISALTDACSNPNLALCTSALMYVYNQDRMTMDIDPKALR